MGPENGRSMFMNPEPSGLRCVPRAEFTIVGQAEFGVFNRRDQSIEFRVKRLEYFK